VGEQVALPVDAAALLRGVEDAGGGGTQALVVVGDDELDAAETAIGERAQEVGPEDLGFRGAGGDAQDLAPAVGVDADGAPATFTLPNVRECRGASAPAARPR
jgi:hypothetical protein